DDRHDAVAADVRVGIAVGRFAVGGPARVGDADVAGGGVTLQVLGQVADAPDLLADVQARPGQRGDAGAVVAAILQPLQTFEQDGFRLTRTNVTDDAAHGASLGVTGSARKRNAGPLTEDDRPAGGTAGAHNG